MRIFILNMDISYAIILNIQEGVVVTKEMPFSFLIDEIG